jgi:GNAT superfamily N-acetyltransferase
MRWAADPASLVSDGGPACDSIQPMSGVTTTIGKGDAALDQRLSDELDRFNVSATPDVAPAAELTVRMEEDGDLVAGVSGWTWGRAAGIGMTWVRPEKRGTGIGARLLSAFEDEARDRGCTHVFVTSFTFQAPGFYQRLGYEEIFRWESVPTPGRDDVHMRKEL